MRLGICDTGVVNLRVCRAFHRWRKTSGHLKQSAKEQRNVQSLVRKKIIKNLNSLFMTNTLSFCFVKWKVYSHVKFAEERATLDKKMALQNPNTRSREKLMNFWKGFLMLKNKQALKKFDSMAQVESRMTISKAMALWKVNSEVQGIDKQMENVHKDIIISRFT